MSDNYFLARDIARIFHVPELLITGVHRITPRPRYIPLRAIRRRP